MIEHVPSLAPLVLLCASLVAAVTDLRDLKIYNWLTFPLLFSGLAMHGVLSGWSGLGHSLTGVGCGFGLLVLGYALGMVGAGDVKLLAGIGAWIGPWLTFQAFLFASIAGGVFAVGILLWTGPIRGERSIRGLRLRVLALLEQISNPLLLRGLLVQRERGESLAQAAGGPERRARLVPFAPMLLIGLAVVVVPEAWRV